MRLLLSVLVVGLISCGLAPLAQVPAVGVISGVVVDASGTGIPDANVELLTAFDGVRRTTTDAGGSFRFESVVAGVYFVRAAAPAGVATVRVAVSDRPVLPLRMVLGRVEPEGRGRGGRAEPAPRPASPAARSVLAPGLVRQEMRVDGISVMPTSGPELNTEAYSKIDEHGFHRAAEDPLSTFSIDVDTASYANVRRFLNDGRLPPADAVRIEELINYFRFDYTDPDGDRPFSVTTDVGPAPWASRHRLVLVGLKARAIEERRTPPRNLVFLLDVSGSMATPDKLPLVKTAMRMLTASLRPADRVAIVVYAGASGVALPSTSGADKARIDAAIAELRPGGSTNGAAGIQLAYDLAAQAFVRGGINRVILATDGDFNVGVTSVGDLIRLIEEKRERGVFLSVLGVGSGNIKDSTMEQLADRGNGNYAYLDSLHEARRVLIAEAGATLVTVAKDVKIQVEFNPARVGAYRLIGYENRVLAHRDFNDDKKDAGEIGAGHTVTALYEIVPPGEAIGTATVDPLKYQSTPRPTGAADSDELLTVKLRYKEPDGQESQPMSTVVRDRVGALSPNLGFAAAIAEFGMLLRASEHKGTSSWADAADLARRHRGPDADGYRAELVRLVDLAAALDAQR